MAPEQALAPLDERHEAAALLGPVVAVEERRAGRRRGRLRLGERRRRLGRGFRGFRVRRPRRVAAGRLVLLLVVLLRRRLLELVDPGRVLLAVAGLVAAPHRVDGRQILVVERRDAGHGARLHGAAHHGPVPLREPLAARRALVRRVAPEDEVVAPLRRARPDVRRGKAPPPAPVQVGHQELVVDLGPRRARPEVLHGIQVGHVDALRGRAARVAELVDVHGEDAEVDAVVLLEEDHGPRLEGDGLRQLGTAGPDEVLAQHALDAERLRHARD